MKKIILFILCALLLASCERENIKKKPVDEEILVSGVCRLKTENGGPKRISQPAVVNMDYTYVSVSDYNSVLYTPQHVSIHTEYDGYFALVVHNVSDGINVYAHTEVGDTVQYFSDTVFVETDENCEELEIVMDRQKHIFNPKLYDITQKGGVKMSYMAVYPGDSLRFSINHDVLTEIRLTVAETTSRDAYKDTCTFAIYPVLNTSSFTFVMPDYNPASERKLIEYVFGIKFTTLHYGAFDGGWYKAAIVPKG